jgi:hypothetical protein
MQVGSLWRAEKVSVVGLAGFFEELLVDLGFGLAVEVESGGGQVGDVVGDRGDEIVGVWVELFAVVALNTVVPIKIEILLTGDTLLPIIKRPPHRAPHIITTIPPRQILPLVPRIIPRHPVIRFQVRNKLMVVFFLD